MEARWDDQGKALAPLLKRAGSVIESQIRGRSMGMTLPPGTTIRIRCGMGTDYPEGAVIAFIAARGVVGHRVVGRATDRQGRPMLLTRGDGMVPCDPPVPPDRVLGEVEAWRHGETWRPLPGPPFAGPGRRLGMALALHIVRAALQLSPALAASVAETLVAIARRLSAAPAASPAEG